MLTVAGQFQSDMALWNEMGAKSVGHALIEGKAPWGRSNVVVTMCVGRAVWARRAYLKSRKTYLIINAECVRS